MCEGDEKVKVLIITVAGASSRFSQSLGTPCLKCLYSPKGIEQTLLYKMLHQPVSFDKYIIVGGYMYDYLADVINENFLEYKNKIVLIKNEKYAEYGSGYSLYMGMQSLIHMNFDEAVFAEGDLFVDPETFQLVCNSAQSVITSNSEDILANKAVAFYFDRQNGIHYLYDTGHKTLKINEEFLGIFNSGQVWKFSDSIQLRKVYDEMAESDWKGTNLIFIEKYFRQLKKEDYNIIKFKRWINCNTVQDYEKI